MSKEYLDAKAIFFGAIEKSNAHERSVYLDTVCGDRVDLRKRVEALLKSHDDAGDFFRIPDSNLEAGSTEEAPGTVIGRYKLLERIGEGGMAVVYMAEQERPIRRKVALKIIKLGMDTKSVIARFEAERQALALMDHPNIAKVLDAGATDTGRPYFVMDLVPGVPITEYCDKKRLSIKERLSLFMSVCSAIQHAHQKGIIHRDVKPSNIMVTMHDGEPVPKVIDFGIAKATNQKLTEKTLFTRYAHIIGTPAYMSPEQAELSDLDVDTRTDIYSLGVLLYELLTGMTPFSEEKLREAGYLQMQKIICEEEPTKPSTKLSTLGEALTDVAKQHNSSPESMPRLIRGDLDWIVLKSLEKDRSHRYDTASALALDIQRHLDNEPVLARAPKTFYRLKKFACKHRSQTITAAAVAVLIIGMIYILSMWNQNRIKLAETETLTHKNILSQARESYAKGDHKKALEYIESILNSKHVGADAQLLSASIQVGDGLFDDAIAKLENLLDEQPEIAGAAYALLARTLWESQSLDGEKSKEIEEYQKRAAELLPETAEAYFLRAMTALTIKEKLELLNEALNIDRGHYESLKLRAFTFYASRKYEKMRDDALGMIYSRSNEPLGYSLRAIALCELGQFEEALAEYNKAIELTPGEDPLYTDLHIQRCETLLRMSDYAQVINAGQACLDRLSDKAVFHFYIFSAFTALGAYEDATTQYHRMINADPHSQSRFRDLCTKHVFNTLGEGRLWHPPDSEPQGAVFFFMLEAEKTYHQLSAKARRLIPNGFEPSWSPNGDKLAFSLGVHGYSGIAVFDLISQEIDLLIVPGSAPKWSPDGQTIAFLRHGQFLRLTELTGIDSRNAYHAAPAEVWIMKADGTDPRRLARGGWLSWSPDSKHIYFSTKANTMVYSIPVEDREAEPKPIMEFPGYTATVSPDNRLAAYVVNDQFLKIKDLNSQTLVTDWVGPPRIYAGDWSPNNHEVSLRSYSGQAQDQTGLWIYDLDRKQAFKVLDRQITSASWSQDGSKLAFALLWPSIYIWVADLDPNLSTAESLGSTRTLEEHYQEMVDYYTRMIEANPEDAEGYLIRAQYHNYLSDEEQVFEDMNKYFTVLNPSQETNLLDTWIKDFLVGLWRSAPTNLGPTVNSSSWDASPSISTDGLELYFTSKRIGGYGDNDIWVTKRKTVNDPWGKPENLGPPVNTSDSDCAPHISANGLELYFGSGRPGGEGELDLWVTTRASVFDPWGEPENLGQKVNSSAFEVRMSVSKDGLSFIFDSERSGGYGQLDLWISTRPTTSDSWGTPKNLGSTVNSWAYDYAPALSANGKTLFFTSGRSGRHEIWLTTRETTNDDWGQPINMGPKVNSIVGSGNPGISADGSTFYFSSRRPGGLGRGDLWQVKINPMSESPQTDSNNGKEVVPGNNH